MPYDFLTDLLVLEVSHFGPDALGGRLADMGARVIKVEDPDGGDPVRRAGPWSVGEENGFSYLHLRWNRGKESVIIDLASEQGRADFLMLAEKADVVIEGMRAGVMARLGLGYAALKAVNPAIVFCSLSGLGESGPYAKLASHGPSFDAYGGLGMPVGESISRYDGPQAPSIGMYAYGLEAAFAVVAAVLRARRTGEGAAIEVAAADCSAHWMPEALDPLLNPDTTFARPGFLDASGKMRFWARMENYRCADGKLIFLMTFTAKSWQALLGLIGRPDLDEIYTREPQTGTEDAEVNAALIPIFASRPRADWLADFARDNVAAMPVNSFADVIADPHFRARENTYRVALQDGRDVTLTSSAIHVGGQDFAMPLAPELGEHNDAIRDEFGLGDG
ncbi:CaiB/BaiF CoA-transferase family protein [Sphingopyxis sp.]|uniref:CaiB/BaiF CoA transferase family protein n=1 Tax=Sphingopyxis sp. TaxID=1908224 RepID=UPI002D78F0D0|nr:CaiB/BaiF CoA-transferase family protein [Sphingopyxis sp.]HET6524439.1 CaiB/BaiF CoA-transferase family protein [Sphingopyxis sp.]